MHLCIITPISQHPRFIRAREPWFRVVDDKIVARTDDGERVLSGLQPQMVRVALEVQAELCRIEKNFNELALAEDKLRELRAACRAIGYERAAS